MIWGYAVVMYKQKRQTNLPKTKSFPSEIFRFYNRLQILRKLVYESKLLYEKYIITFLKLTME